MQRNCRLLIVVVCVNALLVGMQQENTGDRFVWAIWQNEQAEFDRVLATGVDPWGKYPCAFVGDVNSREWLPIEMAIICNRLQMGKKILKTVSKSTKYEWADWLNLAALSGSYSFVAVLVALGAITNKQVLHEARDLTLKSMCAAQKKKITIETFEYILSGKTKYE